EYDERDERRQHKQVAMCEVDHPEDAVDHRVADGDESVDRPQREPVDQLLQEVIHSPSYPLVSSRSAGTVPLTRGRPVFDALLFPGGRPMRSPDSNSLTGPGRCGNSTSVAILRYPSGGRKHPGALSSARNI